MARLTLEEKRAVAKEFGRPGRPLNNLARLYSQDPAVIAQRVGRENIPAAERNVAGAEINDLHRQALEGVPPDVLKRMGQGD